jgi:lactate permease
MSLALAVLPWILLVVFSILTNYTALGIYGMLFERWSMPLTVIPGRPQLLRMAWHAYTWVLIATLIAIPFYRMGAPGLKQALGKTWRRVPRPAFAAAIFFAIAYVLNHSGQTTGAGGWIAADGGANMVAVVANSCATTFKAGYAGVAAFLGLLGGFISGSETSSIVMLSKLHFETVENLHRLADPAVSVASGGEIRSIALLVAAVSGIGGGLASVISPAKLQNAAAVIDRIGLESQVIKSTMVISLVMTAVAALATYVFLAFI